MMHILHMMLGVMHGRRGTNLRACRQGCRSLWSAPRRPAACSAGGGRSRRWLRKRHRARQRSPRSR
eukprot:3609995-Alexandrium_andersonii.AAC.1